MEQKKIIIAANHINYEQQIIEILHLLMIVLIILNFIYLTLYLNYMASIKIHSSSIDHSCIKQKA